MGWRKIVYGRDDDTFMSSLKRNINEGIMLGTSKALEIQQDKAKIIEKLEKKKGRKKYVEKS